MTEYLLTIAVPTYNGAKTIGKMLDILLPQVDERIEVLISDNCSTDNTAEIVKEYMVRYPFISYEKKTENLGADANFLQCMLRAKGKYVMLISDDDIIVEGAIDRITSFLEANGHIEFAYMESVAFKDDYTDVSACHGYKYLQPVEQDTVTQDKQKFLFYCQRLFGFTSSHIWKTERIKSISNPEQYFGTFFLQAYISILCSNRDDYLGIIKGPCIAVGEYGIIGNFDMAEVEGIYYHKMIEFAIKNGYPKKWLERYYIWKMVYLCRNSIIKERASGNKKTKVSNILRATWKYPRAWVLLYPFLFLPPFVCKWILKIVRKRQGRTYTTYINRPT